MDPGGWFGWRPQDIVSTPVSPSQPNAHALNLTCLYAKMTPTNLFLLSSNPLRVPHLLVTAPMSISCQPHFLCALLNRPVLVLLI
jgi:hypothetical protein